MPDVRLKKDAPDKPWWLWPLQISIFYVFVGLIAVIVALTVKGRLPILLERVLAIDPVTLIFTGVKIFIAGGIFLIIVQFLLDRENVLYRSIRTAYRSMLVSPDYYKDVTRIKIDRAVAASVGEGSDQKLDVDYDLKDSSFIAVAEGPIVPEALKTNIAFEDGRLSGLFRTYFTNGNVLAEVPYENGKLNGRSVMYYPYGGLRKEQYFKDGKRHGIFRAWDDDGTLFFEIEFADDRQHGLDRIYRKNGALEFEDRYVRGERVSRKAFNESGCFKYFLKFNDDGEEDTLITDIEKDKGPEQKTAE